MDVINLGKGERIDLEKAAVAAGHALKKIRVGLGWQPQQGTGSEFDLDGSCFLLKKDAGGNPQLLSNENFIYYGHPTKISPDGSVKHSGDNRTGAGDGDDETITVELEKVAAEVDEISFIVTIHDAIARGQNFGQVRNSHISIYDDETNTKLAEFSLEEDFSGATSFQLGSLYKNNAGKWAFKAVGEGYKRTLTEYITAYGGGPVKG